MRQIEREEVGFLPDPADHHQRFAEISLGMARGVVQRDKHLPPAAQLIAHVILDDGVAAGEPVLVSKPIKNPLGRVALLAVLANVVGQPLVDDLGKLVQLGPLDRRRPPIPRRYRKAQHLLHALARNPKMTCRLARTHPVPTGKTHLQIQFHGENAPALPAERKGKSGRVLLRQLRDYPAATVADFSTAVLTSAMERRMYMSTVFISYRRESVAGEARALFNNLVARLGEDCVFMDVDSIALGRDFRRVLQKTLDSSELMLVLIGKNWAEVKYEEGQTRLE